VVSVFDETDPERVSLLYTSRALGQSGRAGTASGIAQWERALEFGGRQWRLVFVPTLAYLANHETRTAWLALAGGLLLTGLLGAVLMVVTGRTIEIELAVAQRTADLAQANEQLEREMAERKRAEVALRQKAEELERFNRMMLGREERILELKAALERASGKAPKDAQVGGAEGQRGV
jgi:C4-dicarboxylate-specific signal transduction histidine kinase